MSTSSPIVHEVDDATPEADELTSATTTVLTSTPKQQKTAPSATHARQTSLLQDDSTAESKPNNSSTITSTWARLIFDRGRKSKINKRKIYKRNFTTTERKSNKKQQPTEVRRELFWVTSSSICLLSSISMFVELQVNCCKTSTQSKT